MDYDSIENFLPGSILFRDIGAQILYHDLRQQLFFGKHFEDTIE